MTGLTLFAFIFVACASGGLVQTVTGFGAGIILMLFFVYAMPMLQASGLAIIIGTLLSISLLYSFRHYIQYKIVVFPALVNFAASTLALKIAASANLIGLKIAFSIFLIVLSIYFTFFSEKVKIKGNLLTATICSALSGAVNGLFGIGGPPMAMYYLTVTDTKEKYIATIQFYFVLTCMYTMIMRIISGIITTDMIGLTIVGILGVLFGQFVGIKIVRRVSLEMMKKLVYAFLAVAGVSNLIGCF